MSRRHAAAVLTLLLPLGLALAAPALADAADASSTAVILAPSDPSDCTLTVTQRVWPPLLLAGEDLDRPGAAASEARFGVAVFDPRAMAP